MSEEEQAGPLSRARGELLTMVFALLGTLGAALIGLVAWGPGESPLDRLENVRANFQAIGWQPVTSTITVSIFITVMYLYRDLHNSANRSPHPFASLMAVITSGLGLIAATSAAAFQSASSIQTLQSDGYYVGDEEYQLWAYVGLGASAASLYFIRRAGAGHKDHNLTNSGSTPTTTDPQLPAPDPQSPDDPGRVLDLSRIEQAAPPKNEPNNDPGLTEGEEEI